jgi:hypothetical protein
MANSATSDLITEVKARAGRPNDTALISRAFVLTQLNEAQLQIVRRSPGLIDLVTIDTTTFTIATNDTTVDISSLNPAHIDKIWILNGSETRKGGLEFIPKDEFFRQNIIIAQQSATEPWQYTRFGNTLYFNRPVSSDYNGLYLRMDYTKWATALTDGAGTSVLSNSDEGLRFFAQARCYDEMALSAPRLETKALKVMLKFEKWLGEYQDYNQMQNEEAYIEF